MKKRSVSPIGALHPILFFAGVFDSCNTTSGGNYSSNEKKASEPATNTVAIASVK